ncbi:hypothetical protein Dsin_021158 [Dipteronia sinensis]|uniref:Reverse transcriptase domain-containing protein n=1 Tax=Dipteronia sinensis TaxID=43782 RepID=A0AAE0AB41_9ROSI|nr:hypothetical protein Dsin_021158 [Dipteronia sinensis]
MDLDDGTILYNAEKVHRGAAQYFRKFLTTSVEVEQEGFSSLISKSERNGDFSGFRYSLSGPKITHLFYADDSLLFTRDNFEECFNIRSLLEVYSSASGQFINFTKSAVCFNRQISSEVRNELADVLGMKVVESHETYLGLPCQTSRSKRAMFDDIKHRVWNKLQSWNNCFFSLGGHEVLLKAVIQSIPVYSMNLLRLHTV